MANPKKGQLMQIIFPMVDKTDFASIESGITASDFNSAATKKIFGVNHGSSAAFTSATISKAATLVRSGIFQQTLKGTEANYDELIVRFTHPSCADQILRYTLTDYDDSDIMSRISDVGSNLLSYLTGMSGMLSDVDSQLLLNASMISDAHSAAILGASHASDAYSVALLNQSAVSELQSALDSQFVWTSAFLSDMNSDLSSQIGGVTASVSASDMSDIASRVWATTEGTRVDSRILVIQSLVSDVDSALTLHDANISAAISDAHSDLGSQIGAITASVSASDISDIASAVWADTIGARVDSRILVVQSMASDAHSAAILGASHASNVESALDSQFAYLSNAISDMHSDLGSQIGGITASIGASDISDIASAVWADTIGARVDSRVLLVLSNVSDVQSALDSQFAYMSNAVSDMHSDIYSALGNISVTLTASDISDIASAVTAAGVNLTASDMSDIASRVWAESIGSQVHSRVTLIQSNVSDIESQLDLTASLVSDIDSQLLLNASMISDTNSLANRIDEALIYSRDTAQAGTTANITLAATEPATNSLFNDNVIVLVSGTGAGQVRPIVNYVGATKIASVEPNWEVSPDSTTIYMLTNQFTNHSHLNVIDDRLSVVQSSLSDVESALDSQFTYLSAAISDVDSQLLLNASMISDVDSALTLHDINVSATLSDIDSQVNLLPTASALVSDIWSAATADPLAANIKEINDTSVLGDGNATPWGPE